MKTSDDVEQGALQTVSLRFYVDATDEDRLWLVLSISTALLLSVTHMVQCLPEARDWFWHRLLAKLPLCHLFKSVRMLWLMIFLVVYRFIAGLLWMKAWSPFNDACEVRKFGGGAPQGCRRGTLVPHAVQLWSSWCMLVAALVWWASHKWQHCRRQRHMRHEAYDGSHRLARKRPGRCAPRR